MEFKNKTENVFLWGAFDILHEGHFQLFREASKLGDLYAIIIPDKFITEVKHIVHNEVQRREHLLKSGAVKGVFIDALPNIKCFNEVEPNIFCFGYDQDILWQKKLREYMLGRFPQCKFFTMTKYADIHSSDLRKEMDCFCGSGKKYKKCHGA